MVKQLKRKDIFTVGIEGHVKISEYNSKEDYENKINPKIVLDKRNAIHPENVSILVARGATHRINGNISYMYFGNGGATIDPLGNVILNSPNTTGAADLYNPTFFEFVDDTEGAPAGNFMDVRHTNGLLYSFADITCVIQQTQPLGQLPNDTTGSINLNTQPFSFNEMGLKTADFLLLSHITFAPVLKTANRVFEVVWTWMISVD